VIVMPTATQHAVEQRCDESQQGGDWLKHRSGIVLHAGGMIRIASGLRQGQADPAGRETSRHATIKPRHFPSCRLSLNLCQDNALWSTA
jgi:hypothetical protein